MEGNKMDKLSFYDVKAKKKFMTTKYKMKTKMVNGRKRKFAIAKSPMTGIDCWRVVG